MVSASKTARCRAGSANTSSLASAPNDRTPERDQSLPVAVSVRSRSDDWRIDDPIAFVGPHVGMVGQRAADPSDRPIPHRRRCRSQPTSAASRPEPDRRVCASACSSVPRHVPDGISPGLLRAGAVVVSAQCRAASSSAKPRRCGLMRGTRARLDRQIAGAGENPLERMIGDRCCRGAERPGRGGQRACGDRMNAGPPPVSLPPPTRRRRARARTTGCRRHRRTDRIERRCECIEHIDQRQLGGRGHYADIERATHHRGDAEELLAGVRKSRHVAAHDELHPWRDRPRSSHGVDVVQPTFRRHRSASSLTNSGLPAVRSCTSAATSAGTSSSVRRPSQSDTSSTAKPIEAQLHRSCTAGDLGEAVDQCGTANRRQADEW